MNYKNLIDIEISPDFIDYIIGELYNQTIITPEIKETFFVDSIYETVYDRKMFE